MRCDGLFEFDPLNFDVIIHELVDVSDNSAALDVHKYERRDDLVVEGSIRAGDRAGIDVELSLVLICLELVGVACDEDVAIQLPVYGGQCCETKCLWLNQEVHISTGTSFVPSGSPQGTSW